MAKPSATLGTIIGGLVLLFVIVIPILRALSFFVIINPAQVGVHTRLGRLKGKFDPGFHFITPVIDSVIKYNTRLITYETSSYPKESKADYTDYPVDTTTKDGQPVHIKYTVRFRIDPSKVLWIYQNLGDEEQVVEKVVKTDSRGHVRTLAREFAAQDLYSGNIRELEELVSKELQKLFAEKGLVLDEFVIRSIDFSEDYVKAIEQKQIEKERVETEKYKAEQEKYRKQAMITKAQGEAEAQRLLQKNLTKELLTKMYIEKWDGHLPQVATGSNGVILDLGTLKK